MKLNFYISMFLLIVASPLFFYKLEKFKKGKIEYVQASEVSEKLEKMKLIEVIDSKEELFLFGFNEYNRNEAYFDEDTLDIKLIAGSLSGYNLTIKMIGDTFTSKLINYDCTWWEELKIRSFSLKLENRPMVDGGKLKGEIFCEGHHLNKYRRERIEKVKIEGSFEMNLVERSKISI